MPYKQPLTEPRQSALRARHDFLWAIGPGTTIRPAEEIERTIRAIERDTVRYLISKPWAAGRNLRGAIAYSRRRHTESIARSRAAGDIA